VARLWDISPLVDSALAVWPGDTPPTREVLFDMRRGDHLTLSTLRATVHLGAHADAPSHYGKDAPTVDALALDTYVGPARVVRVAVRRGCRVARSDLGGPIDTERVLIATGTYPDRTRFDPAFAALEPALIEHLAAAGVRLVGIDTPSVDLADSQDLPAHRACLDRGVAILEGLVLDGVPPGRYELIALPLKLAGFDASPVRAVLREV
jgi:arylformamidase